MSKSSKGSKGVGFTKGKMSATRPPLNKNVTVKPAGSISPKGTTGGIVKTAGGEMLRNSAAGK